MSRVDVVVPCYNYGRYLRQCVESILTQAGVDVRVLVIDDCSSDDTPQIGGALAAADPRVEFRRHEQNRGHIATYNEGLFEWVTAEYCLLISADDLLTPGALLRATTVMDDQTAISFAYGKQQVFVDAIPAIEPPSAIAAFEVIAGLDFVRRMCETGSNPVTTPTVVCRTSHLRQVGGYRPELPHTADMELWLRLAAVGDVAVIPDCQAFKRAHPAQMQHDFVASVRDFEQRQRAFAMFGDPSLNPREVPQEWLCAASSALAWQAFWSANHHLEQGCVAEAVRLLAYARRLEPAIATHRSWKLMSWKRRLGAKNWRWMRPWLDRVRGIGQPAVAGSAS